MNGISIDSRRALALFAKNFYKDPSKAIKTIGITGTNGKTTTSFLLESILVQSGRKVGRIGTVNYKIGERIIEPINTTPSSLLLNQLLRDMVERSFDYAVMEVSSHALDQERTHGISFDTAVFTNIQPEHLDYHKNFDAYLEAKKKLFSGLDKGAAAVLNADDPRFRDIKTAASSKRVFSFGIDNNADIRAKDIKIGLGGSSFILETDSARIAINTNLIGRHNVSNILAAAGGAISENIDLNEIKNGVEGLRGVPGRLEPVESGGGYLIFIDYAHTDDGLKKVLEALAAIKKRRLIVLFGCGGQRDRAKRPRMGRVASLLADYVIISSDNPRNENPKLIAEEAVGGIKKGFEDYEIILDRREAIARALSLAKDQDIVLIAGKGHEKYQVVGDEKIPFSDKAVVEGLTCISKKP